MDTSRDHLVFVMHGLFIHSAAMVTAWNTMHSVYTPHYVILFLEQEAAIELYVHTGACLTPQEMQCCVDAGVIPYGLRACAQRQRIERQDIVNAWSSWPLRPPRFFVEPDFLSTVAELLSMKGFIQSWRASAQY